MTTSSELRHAAEIIDECWGTGSKAMCTDTMQACVMKALALAHIDAGGDVAAEPYDEMRFCYQYAAVRALPSAVALSKAIGRSVYELWNWNDDQEDRKVIVAALLKAAEAEDARP